MAGVYNPVPYLPFDDVTFPTDISYGSAGGPEYATEITALPGGAEQATPRRAESRERWNIAYGVKHEDDVDKLMRFFMCRRGRAAGFWFEVPNTGVRVRARFDTDYLPSTLSDYKAESADVSVVQIVDWGVS